MTFFATKRSTHPSLPAFTLSELLIALAILGIIASFTIPKVLESANSSKHSAAAKEAAAMISGAFSTYKLEASVSSTTTAGVLTSYMNFVTTDTDNNNSSVPAGQAAIGNCSSTQVCLMLHSGGTLAYNTGASFGGTAATNAIYFNFDPDSTGSAAGGVTFIQYYDRRITSNSNAATGTTTGGTQVAPVSDPPWLANWHNL